MNLPLIDDELRKSLPTFRSIENDSNPMVYAKYHHAGEDWTWWAIAFDGRDAFFGLVLGFDCELGHFSLSELHQFGVQHGDRVQRDGTFTLCRLRDLFPITRVVPRPA